MGARAAIFGCLGPMLTARELDFFVEAAPWGFILFGRNVVSPDQLVRLTEDLRAAVGRDAPVLIDQEGGRVARLRAPAWREWQPALEECSRFPGRDLRVRAMGLRYRLIASELRAAGIDVNCAPVLDVLRAETHGFIRQRCYGDEPAEVAAIGRAVAEGLVAGGVVPVMKHIPGHGRATLDSHHDLPVVDAPLAELMAVDFAPFRALADLPMAMTSHLLYTAIDPEAPATLSPGVVAIIRGQIGFDGLLITDDLSMKALSGGLAARASGAIAAGCDIVLHCNADPAEMAAVAGAAPEVAGACAARAERALAARNAGSVGDGAALDAEFAALRRAAHA